MYDERIRTCGCGKTHIVKNDKFFAVSHVRPRLPAYLLRLRGPLRSCRRYRGQKRQPVHTSPDRILLHVVVAAAAAARLGLPPLLWGRFSPA